VIVYTCLTGGKDGLPRVPIQKGVQYIYYSDKDLKNKDWEFRPLVYYNPDNRRIARYHKVNSHLLFPNEEYVLWLDGNIEVKWYPEEILELLSTNDNFVATMIHPSRNCIFQEFHAVRILNFDDPLVMAKQEQRYKREGMPLNIGLPETNVLLRKQNDDCREFNTLWWKEINGGSKRDQLSFSYVMWKMNKEWVLIPQWMIIKHRHYIPTSKDT